jgi:O-antigen biosynthesis protein
VTVPLERKRLLMVDVSIPQPDRDSGSLRSFNLMRLMRSLGHEVDFLAENGRLILPYAADLQEAGINVLDLQGRSHPGWFASHHQDYHTVILCRYHLASYWLPLVRHISKAKVIFDTVDLHYVRELREAVLRNDPRLFETAKATQRIELSVVERADVTWVVSPVEKTMLRELQPRARVEVLSNLHHASEAPASPTGRSGILFVGGGRHPPNVDAAKWLLKEIFPAIRHRIPQCELHLVGTDLDDALKGCDIPPGVIIHGHVPDLRPLLERSVVGLAPLRFGAGVKGKINQYMAHGVPTVATSCAIEGMALCAGHDVLVADEVETFADAVARLYHSPTLWRELSDNGRRNVREHFSAAVATSAIVATFKHLAFPNETG